jgi:hypothetical protein
MHVCVPASQIGAAALLQSELVAHSKQAPDGAHTGAVALRASHSVPDAQVRHVLLAISQIGLVVALQSELAPHATHFPPTQAGAAGFNAAHSLPPLHARHVFDAESQIGVAALQEAAVHGVAPSGSLVSVLESVSP